MRERLPCQLSVSYGASEPETLDIFPAAVSGPAPIFVFLHGVCGACSVVPIPASWLNTSPRLERAWWQSDALAPHAPSPKLCANAARRSPGFTRTRVILAATLCVFMWAAAPRVRISRR